MLRRASRVLVALLIAPTPGAAQDYEEGEDEVVDEPLELPLFGETSFSLVSTSQAQYRFDDFDTQSHNDDFLGLVEKLDLVLRGEELELSLRLDAFVPVAESDCPPDLDLNCLRHDVRPERFLLRWGDGDVTIQLGDSYVVFGRGLALSLRKVDILGIDTTLRGANVTWDPGGRFFLNVVGGTTNPQNLDPTTLQLHADPHDLVAGARIGTRLGEWDDVTLAAHVVRVWFDDEFTPSPSVPPEPGDPVTALVYGYTVEAPALADGRLSLYGEANAMIREGVDRLDLRLTGRAVYGAAQLQLDQWSWLVEWKDYRSFILSHTADLYRVYSAAPSLDLDTERYRGIANSRGTSTLLSYSVPESPWSMSWGGIVYGHEDEVRDCDGDGELGHHPCDPWDGILTTHGTFSLRRDNDAIDPDQIGWSIDGQVGYRREILLYDFSETFQRGDLDWQVVHGQIETLLAVGEHGFDLLVEQRFERRRGPFDYADYVRGGVTLTWTIGGTLSLSPSIRWNTERADAPDLYPLLEAKWEFRPGSHVRLQGGRTPGGRLCSGGVCRDVPASESVLGELVLRL